VTDRTLCGFAWPSPVGHFQSFTTVGYWGRRQRAHQGDQCGQL